MKLSVSQRRMVITVGLVLLGLYAAFSYQSVRVSNSRLYAAEEDLGEMEQKIDDIKRLSSAPRVAALELESSDATLNRIHDALSKAGLSQDALSNQAPQTPQRIGQTDFTMRTVEIYLKHAPLEKIVAFCDALRDEETGSVVRDLDLSEPKSSGPTEQWKSQMILTQMIFSPKSES